MRVRGSEDKSGDEKSDEEEEEDGDDEDSRPMTQVGHGQRCLARLAPGLCALLLLLRIPCSKSGAESELMRRAGGAAGEDEEEARQHARADGLCLCPLPRTASCLCLFCVCVHVAVAVAVAGTFGSASGCWVVVFRARGVKVRS
eukprot:772421-Rhodomonas_salina.2